MKFKNITIQLAIAIIWFLSGKASGQIGIGVSGSVNSSAALEVNSNAKGFLPPRMTTNQRDAISSPADGLIIYNSTTGKLNIRENGDWSELSTTNRDQSISGNRNYAGNNAFSSSTTLGGTNVISGTTTISGVSTFNNSATFNNSTTLAGSNSITGPTTVSGVSTFNNTTTFNNPTTFNSVIRVPNYTTANRNGIGSQTTGMFVYNSSTNLMSYRDNNGWKELSSLSGNNAFTGNNTYAGTSTFNNSATFNNPTSLVGTTTISGTSTFNNTATFASPAVFNSSLKLPTAAPGTTASGMIYFNTSNNLLTVRNSTNNGYIEFGSLSGNNTFSGANSFTGNNTYSGTNTFSNSNTFSGANSFTGNNTYSGTNTFTGNVVIPKITTATRDALSSPTDGMIIYNTTTNKLNIRENGVWSEMTSNNRANTLTGTNTVNGMTTFNGMITMNAHMMVPMAELGFYSTTGVTTNISSTAWVGNSNSSTGWSIVNWPAIGSTVGTNTFADSMSGLSGRINHTNSGSGAGVLAYNGSTTKHFHIALTFSYQGSGANGNNHSNLIFGVFKNGVLLPESIVAVANVTTFASTAIHVMTDMKTNDYLDFRVIGIGGSTAATLTFISGNFFAMGI